MPDLALYELLRNLSRKSLNRSDFSNLPSLLILESKQLKVLFPQQMAQTRWGTLQELAAQPAEYERVILQSDLTSFRAA
jgi:hypothetical protein